MKSPKFFAIVVLVLVQFSLFHPVKAQNNAPQRNFYNSRIVLPTAQDALKTVFSNGQIPLSSLRNCQPHPLMLETRTIFDYLTALIGFQAESKSRSSLDYSVKLVRRNSKPAWEASLLFNNRFLFRDTGEEIDINKGVKFLMRTQDKKMIRGSLTCI